MNCNDETLTMIRSASGHLARLNDRWETDQVLGLSFNNDNENLDQVHHESDNDHQDSYSSDSPQNINIPNQVNDVDISLFSPNIKQERDVVNNDVSDNIEREPNNIHQENVLSNNNQLLNLNQNITPEPIISLKNDPEVSPDSSQDSDIKPQQNLPNIQIVSSNSNQNEHHSHDDNLIISAHGNRVNHIVGHVLNDIISGAFDRNNCKVQHIGENVASNININLNQMVAENQLTDDDSNHNVHAEKLPSLEDIDANIVDENGNTNNNTNDNTYENKRIVASDDKHDNVDDDERLNAFDDFSFDIAVKSNVKKNQNDQNLPLPKNTGVHLSDINSEIDESSFSETDSSTSSSDQNVPLSAYALKKQISNSKNPSSNSSSNSNSNASTSINTPNHRSKKNINPRHGQS